MANIKAETTVSFPESYVADLLGQGENLPQILPNLIKSSKIAGREGDAEIVDLELNLTEDQKKMAGKFLDGDMSRVKAKVVRSGKSVNVEQIDGPLKSFSIRMNFNGVAANKTAVNADVDFDTGSWIANKGISLLFKTFSGSMLSNVDAKIQQAIAKGELKLPPPKPGNDNGTITLARNSL